MDGCSVNRRFVKLHEGSDDLVYRVHNPYAENKRFLYFISDPPHLLKTLLNCLIKRSLWVSGCCNLT